MRRIWIVTTETAITQAVIDTATAANCSEIAQGIPLALIGILAPGDLPCAYEEPAKPISLHPRALFADKTQVTADGVDIATVTVLGDATAIVTLDVFFAGSEGDAVEAEMTLDAGGRRTLTIGPFEAGTVGQVIVCSQERTVTPYPRVVVEVVNA